MDSSRDTGIRMRIAASGQVDTLTKYGIAGGRSRCRRDVSRRDVDSAMGRAGQRRRGEIRRAPDNLKLHSSGNAAMSVEHFLSLAY
jgi:hypothetical protein